jgi:hypothetical protein
MLFDYLIIVAIALSLADGGETPNGPVRRQKEGPGVAPGLWTLAEHENYWRGTKYPFFARTLYFLLSATI